MATKRANALTAAGDYAGAAVWRRITDTIGAAKRGWLRFYEKGG